MYRIGVSKTFSAAHRLEGHPGRCSSLHGHTWKVEAVFSAPQIEGGMLVDFDDARAALGEVIAPYDHSYLNEVAPFDAVPPTAENVAREMFGRLEERARSAGWNARLESVTVWESPDTWAANER